MRIVLATASCAHQIPSPSLIWDLPECKYDWSGRARMGQSQC